MTQAENGMELVTACILRDIAWAHDTELGKSAERAYACMLAGNFTHAIQHFTNSIVDIISLEINFVMGCIYDNPDEEGFVRVIPTIEIIKAHNIECLKCISALKSGQKMSNG